MKTDELREKYLEFFVSKGCVRRPSDVLVPRDDKTVLFTPAGMNQFKPQFLGIGPLEFTKAATCQKCLRTGDIDNVGVTAYHHTFFEMLGNFSFGDYFKQEAIQWAWEFLTGKKWLALPPDRLTVTVYKDDDEAYDIWHNEIKLTADRISREDEGENFWPASAPSQGPDGVCGPCSEIYYHPPDGSKKVEIWNLVFTQFNRVGDPPNNLRPLPKKNIDTGMGLERTAAVMQGKVSNYDIDILRPLCEAAAEALKQKYVFDSPVGRPARRIADHLRAITFCIHEGVEPGPKEERYIIRLLLRRAVMEGYLLGMQEPFLHQLVPAVVEQMKGPYPELRETAGTVANVIKEEEKHFLNLLDKSMPRFRKLLEQAKSSGGVISGDDAFDLHQTDGFLIEISTGLADREGLKVDRKRFNVRMKEHEETSKGGKEQWGVMAAGLMDELRNEFGETEFLGYETTYAEAKVLGIVAEDQRVQEYKASDEPIRLILDRTPFYAESGGQVGDTGVITTANGEFEVIDTQKASGLIEHRGKLRTGSVKVGDTVMATVHEDRRSGIRRAHSATHLLHHALRTTLGPDAMQRGSKVEDDVLRFDFSHKSGVTSQELTRVEDIINQRIAEGAGVEIKFMKIEDAKKNGAMALFGEKYPDIVRVVGMGDFSKELCGGTHLTNTGQVGLCKITSEEGVSAGVRRITALTGQKALQRIREQESVLKELAQLLKATRPDELARRVTALQDELRDTKKELAKQTSQSLSGTVDDLVKSAREINGVKVISHHPKNSSREALREFVDQIREKVSPVALILGAEIEGKVALIAAVSKELVKKGVNASDCVKAAAKVAGGGGGGRPDMAEAGGSKPDKIDEALAAGVEFFQAKLT